MIIQACIQDDEYDIELYPTEISNNKTTQWESENSKSVIKFTEDKMKIENLEISSNITTDHEII